MKWHYAINREKLGPVEEAEFSRLVDRGVITEATLVWTKGMPGWKPYSEVKPAAVEQPVPPPDAADASAVAKVKCAACDGIFPLPETVRFGDRHVCAECRPAYLEQRQVEREATDGGGEAERNSRLPRERLIRTVGAFYYFVGGLFTFVGFRGRHPGTVGGPVGAVILLSVGAGILVAGREVHQLRRRAKLALGIVSGLGLITFPIGTLINAYVLGLAFTGNGRAVLSAEYREVIAGTPDIPCRISWIVAALMSAGMFLQIAKGG